jgi:glucose-6-phosphate 1-dehydrogenase
MSFDLVLFGGTGDLGLAQADARAVSGLSARHAARRWRIIGVWRGTT